MEAKPRPMGTVLLLGASLLGFGALLWIVNAAETEPPPSDVLVHQRIIAPSGMLVFNGSVQLTPTNATVLGALLRGAEIGGFEVNVTHSYLGHAFVEAIAGHRNQGTCGWVYDHNGIRGARAVDAQSLRHQDQVRWGWDCVG